MIVTVIGTILVGGIVLMTLFTLAILISGWWRG
jgi:hypothetical protein